MPDRLAPAPAAARPVPLREAALRGLAPRVAVPGYDRSALWPGIVHLGVGAFHRSHQAVYLDDLAAARPRDGWSVTGVSLRSGGVHDTLRAQDGLYTVMVRGGEAEDARVIGVLRRLLRAPDDTRAVLDVLSDPRTRIVTLTVTAGGYAAEDHLDAWRPRSAAGYLVEALARRRRAGTPPFTVLSCDNLAANGATARTAVTELARVRDRRLAQWIADEVAFPDSMVDRITPTTRSEDRALLATRWGVRDLAPVVTERYSAWVVQDRFCTGRPPLEEVGVRFVDDVEPYTRLKTRLLNATHSALGYLGSLAGLRFTSDAIADPLFAAFTARCMRDELTPVLRPPAGVDVAAYRRTVFDRLADPALGDELARLCRNGSSKVPGLLIPAIADLQAARRPHPLLTLAVAAWCRYLSGKGDDGTPLPLDDPLAAHLRRLARLRDPAVLLHERAGLGRLGARHAFVGAVRRDLRDLALHGTRDVLAARLADRDAGLAVHRLRVGA